MIFQLKRMIFRQTDTIGALFAPDGDWLCWTLEDTYRRQKVYGETCIPYGMYELDFHRSPRFSPVFGHEMIHLQNVKYFEFILIHPGNNRKDTQGCILVGDGVSPVRLADNAITNSRDAYFRIYEVLAGAMKKEKCHLNIHSL